MAGEPYHVVFNFNVAYGDPETYVTDSTIYPNGISVRSLDPDSDYPPLPEYPYIDIVHDQAMNGFGLSIPVEAGGTAAKATVKDVHKFANPDRRGRLPKGFQARMGFVRQDSSGDPVPYVNLFRYNLTEERDKYVALKASPHPVTEETLLYLEYSWGPGFYVQSDPYISDWSLLNDSVPSLQFIIKEDKLELYVDQPGTLVATLDLPEPLIAGKSTSLELFEVLDVDASHIEYATMNSLLIFDAYV